MYTESIQHRIVQEAPNRRIRNEEMWSSPPLARGLRLLISEAIPRRLQLLIAVVLRDHHDPSGPITTHQDPPSITGSDGWKAIQKIQKWCTRRMSNSFFGCFCPGGFTQVLVDAPHSSP